MHLQRNSVVFGVGPWQRGPVKEDERIDRIVAEGGVFTDHDPRVQLAVVGEGPGQREDEQGEPFVGPSGQLLNRMLAGIDLRREDVYLCNAVCCRPPGNRTPEKKELEACRPFLEGQLRNVRPRVILALGATAARALTQTSAPVGQLRGRWWEWEETLVRVTYHPAALLREHTLKRPTWEDLKEVRAALKGKGLRR